MFNLSMVFVALFTAAAVQAEPVECSFTEPFITITADKAANTVTILDGFENLITVYPALSYTYSNDVWTVTWNDNQAGIRVLEFYNDAKGGSDGMSDFLFPMTGKTILSSGVELIGGCSTASQPAIDPYAAPFPGCYEVLGGVYEDGASYYQAVGEKIIDPLKADAKTLGLGTFLEQALVVQGYMELTLNVCKSIDEAVK